MEVSAVTPEQYGFWEMARFIARTSSSGAVDRCTGSTPFMMASPALRAASTVACRRSGLIVVMTPSPRRLAW